MAGDAAGLLAASLSLVVAFFAPRLVLAVPLGALAVAAAAAWGFAALVRTLGRRRGRPIADGEAAALVPLLALALVLAHLARDRGWGLPGALLLPTVLPALMLSAGACVLLAGRRPGLAWPVGGAAVAAMAVAYLSHALAHPPRAGAWATLLATTATVAALTATQAMMGARWGRPWLASPLALALTAMQALDGTVSYLAVANPFGWLATASREQVALSALLIAKTGPGYIIAKCALAVTVARLLGRPGGSHVPDTHHRFVAYMALAYVSMVPAMYSSLNLFS